MKRILAVVICSLLSLTKMNAQDLHFSQIYEHSILRNPALIGIMGGDHRFSANYRDQWASVGVPFRTMVATYERRFLLNRETADYISIGLGATYDHSGSIDFTTLKALPGVNFSKILSTAYNSYISLGVSGGYMQRNINPSKMTFGNQYVNGVYSPYNPTHEKIESTSIKNWDLSLGLSLTGSFNQERTANYYIGFAGYHILEPKQTFNDLAFINLSARWTGQLGTKIMLNDEFSFAGHLNINYQNPYSEVLVGGLVGYKPVVKNEFEPTFAVYAGAFMRLKDAWIPTFKLEYQSLVVTVSYDANISDLRVATSGQGGLEISLVFREFLRGFSSSMNCPSFSDIPQRFD